MQAYLATGQTACYDTAGQAIPCAGSGQDGELHRGLGWPAPRFEPEGALVRDRLTGLLWPRDAAPAEFPLTWAEAQAFVAGLNRNAYLGRQDWRLPNRRELRSLLSYAEARPALPAGHPFENVFAGWYWSATPAAGAPGHAWYVNLAGARMFYGGLDQSFMLWPVAGRSPVLAGTGAPAEAATGVAWPVPRFELAGEVVRDCLTGLYWRREASLGGTLGWAEALAAVRELGTGWRLPNINELESLVDAARFAPALPAGHPFAAVEEVYWSATTSAYETDWAWALYLDKGAVGVGHKPFARFYVWAVRDGE